MRLSHPRQLPELLRYSQKRKAIMEISFPTKARPERVYTIDWLRCLGVLMMN